MPFAHGIRLTSVLNKLIEPTSKYGGTIPQSKLKRYVPAGTATTVKPVLNGHSKIEKTKGLNNKW